MLRTTGFLLVVLVWIGFSPASAMTAEQVQKLLPDDGAVSDQFGTVAVDGDTAVIAAPGDDQYAGSAYVYTRSDGVWTLQAKLVADDRTPHDFLGHSVDLDGDTVVIGANGDNGTLGSAYIFVRSGNVWTQQAKFLNDDGTPYDYFGISVGVGGDTAVIGVRGDDDYWEDSGSAYIFVRSGDTWTQQAKLHADDALLFDFFGSAVAIEGDTALIGAEGGPGFFIGSVYVFTRSGDVWTQQAKLLADDGRTGHGFGKSVAMDGDTAVIGSFRSDSYVFVRSGDVWTQQAKLLAEDGARVPGPVDIDGNTAVVVSPKENEFAASAYVFTRSGEVWTQQAKALPEDPAPLNRFGYSVAVEGSTVMAGAPGNADNGANSGAAYVFLLRTSIAIDIKPDSYPNSVNPRSRGVVPVAILGSESFDVTGIDVSSLEFGPGGAAVAHKLNDSFAYNDHLRDVNLDGLMDLVTHYRMRDTGIVCGDESARVTFETIDGQPFEGSDSVVTVGCRAFERPGIWLRDQRRVIDPGGDAVIDLERK